LIQLLCIVLDIVLERPFSSLILLEGTTITLSCNPTLLPEFVTLSWIHNGNKISDEVDGIAFSPVDKNHNLIIESPVVNNSGIYHCIAAPSVNLSINVTVVESKKRYSTLSNTVESRVSEPHLSEVLVKEWLFYWDGYNL